MPYADQTQLVADYLPEAKSPAETAAVGRILDAVSAFVDTYCRRPSGYFNPAAAGATEKRVRGEGQHFLRLPVHVFGSITEVKTNFGTVIDSSAYYESDKNGWLYAENDSLYPQASFDLCSPNTWQDGAIFKVNARWGYAATPLDLAEAVRLTVARIYGTQRGTLGQLTVEGFLREKLIPSAALEILNKYKKREFEI